MSEKEATIARAGEGPTLRFPWGAIQWLCNAEIDPDAQQTLGLVYIQPGQKNPLHLHPNCEELLFVLSGECDHRLDDAVHHLEAGSMIRIPAGAKHDARNNGWEPVRMLICYSSPDRQTVFLENDG
jgi:quercetin dioxygenase-like cupin family protein